MPLEKCNNCGEEVEADRLKREPYCVETEREHIECKPEDSYPAEYQVVCPECGAENSFEAVLTAEGQKEGGL